MASCWFQYHQAIRDLCQSGDDKRPGRLLDHHCSVVRYVHLLISISPGDTGPLLERRWLEPWQTAWPSLLCSYMDLYIHRSMVVRCGHLSISVPPGSGPCSSRDGKIPGGRSDHPVQRIGLRLGSGTQQTTAGQKLRDHAVAARPQLQ